MTNQRFGWRGWLAVSILLASAASTVGAQSKAVAGVVNPGTAIVRHDIEQAVDKIRNDDFEGADRDLSRIISEKEFGKLGVAEQRSLYYTAAMVAAQLSDWKRAHALAMHATEAETAGAEDWRLRFQTAMSGQDIRDAASSLATIAERWPSTLSDIHDDAIVETVYYSRRPPGSDKVWLPLVEALRKADWRTIDQREPSQFWVDLALYYLQHSSPERASEVAAHVTDPKLLIGMRSDKQFDRVVGRNRYIEDIDRAARDDVDLLQVAARRMPQKMAIRNGLVWTLLVANRPAEALQVADETLARVKTTTEADPAFDDLDDEINWAYDVRARALRRLGRWDEALDQWLKGSEHKEHGGVNVSQAINVGYFYCDLGRPEEARSMVAKVAQVSPFGALQLESVKHAAALLLHDESEAARALKFIKDHQSDSPGTYQWALARANDVEAGVKLLVARLKDPKLRTDALAEVQQYADVVEPAKNKEWAANFRVVVARPEVQRAVAKVGRAGHYNIVDE
jgi:tetratricopeptide (TPR) repeat protein